MAEPMDRRRFLVGAAAGTAVTATTLVPHAAEAREGEDRPEQVASTSGAAEVPEAPEPLHLLTAAEAAFFAAAADAMIPADELSPSGSECGIVTFLDRQLASAYGAGARMYRSGPFEEGRPGYGYQLPLTPLEFFRIGVAEANAWVASAYGAELDMLPEADRDAALKAIEAGKAEFARLDPKTFFAALLQIVMEGFFADPMYGGNRGMASWRMIGYPGLPATYADKIEAFRGRRYEAEPMSIADFS